MCFTRICSVFMCKELWVDLLVAIFFIMAIYVIVINSFEGTFGWSYSGIGLHTEKFLNFLSKQERIQGLSELRSGMKLRLRLRDNFTVKTTTFQKRVDLTKNCWRLCILTQCLANLTTNRNEESLISLEIHPCTNNVYGRCEIKRLFYAFLLAF